MKPSSILSLPQYSTHECTVIERFVINSKYFLREIGPFPYATALYDLGFGDIPYNTL